MQGGDRESRRCDDQQSGAVHEEKGKDLTGALKLYVVAGER